MISFLRVALRDFHVRNCRGISEGQKLESGPRFSKSKCKVSFNFCVNFSASSAVLFLAPVTVATIAASAAGDASVMQRLRDDLSWTDMPIPRFLRGIYRIGMIRSSEESKANCNHVEYFIVPVVVGERCAVTYSS